MLWGLKTVSCLDVWSFEHLLNGMTAGYLVRKLNLRFFKQKYCLESSQVSLERVDLLLLLFFAYAWESTEHYFETGLAGPIVQYWFQGVEYWPNRLIFDPTILVIGYFIGQKHVWIRKPARVISLVWMFIHLFVFPHSMYLQPFF